MVDEPPLRRRWLPANEAALRESFDEGMFEETNWCELKREVATTKSANLELARDLASLAVDGGTLIVGLDEAAPEGNPLHPVELRGLGERIESVAATRVEPPLQVETNSIPAPAKPGQGYVLVHVPASPLAPHQVGGVYFGRGDKQKRRLPDAEVERLFARRANWSEDSLADLEEFATARQRPLGSIPRLLLVARPVASNSELCRSLVGTLDWENTLRSLRAEVAADPLTNDGMQTLYDNYPSIFREMQTQTKTPSGARMAVTWMDRNNQSGQPPPMVLLELDESGCVRFGHDEVGASAQYNNIPYNQFYFDRVADLIFQVTMFLRTVSRRTGYASPWDISVQLEKLVSTRPRRISDPTNTFGTSFGAGYEVNVYRRSARATVLDLDRAPGQILERLLGAYARSVEVDDQLRPLFDLAAPRRNDPLDEED